MVISDPGECDGCSVGIDIVLSKLNPCSNELSFNISEFFAIHGIDSGDVLLTCGDVVSHPTNGWRASRNVPGCSRVTCANWSPIKVAFTITEAIVARCDRKEIALKDLRMYCAVIGLTTA